MTLAKPVLFLAASGLALTLGGCKVDNRPLLARMSGSAPPPADYAALPQPAGPYDPAYGVPPPPPPLPAYDARAYGSRRYPASYLPPDRAYPYAERAYGFDRAFYDLPPDYGFGYDGEEPWVWQTADDSLMFAEPYGDDYRFYYYEPGADYPYFIRDANYGYAFGDNGVLLALFDAAGALLGGDAYDQYYPSARQYWTRGYDLRRAYVGGAPRFAVDPGVWSRRAPLIQRIDQTWLAAPQRQPAWRQWRAAAGPVVQRFDSVRPARIAMARQGFAGRADNGLHLGWQRGRHEGWRGAAVPPGIAMQPARPEFRGGAPRMARQDRGEAFARPARPGFAPSVEAHGRNASGRVTDHFGEAQALRERGRARMAEAAPPVAVQRGGEGRGWRDGGGGRFAQAAPPAAPAPQPNGGGWHGGGDHGPHGPPQAQPQAQPQPQRQAQAQAQAQAQGGQPHGQGKGQAQQGGDHGHRHGG